MADLLKDTVEPDWEYYNDIVAKNIEKCDISRFTKWDVIRRTMFGISKTPPLKYLQSLPDWDRWQKAIVESPVGTPGSYKPYPQSSSHLIMQAEHLARFISSTDCKLEELNKVFEFGAGYGCMCRLIHNLGFTGEYVIMDLPALLDLQKYYLGETTKGNIRYLSDETDFKEQMSGDKSLFIATWSISEVSYAMRQRILDEVHAKYIFITFQAKHNGFDNKEYFEKFGQENKAYKWYGVEMPYSFPHKLKHYYLFGTRRYTPEPEYQAFKQMTKNNRFEVCLSKEYLKETSLKVDWVYIIHTSWAARILAGLQPDSHIDIGSSLYFVGMASAFLPSVEYYDCNPIYLPLSDLGTGFADLKELPFSDNSISSLSCMHVVEHIGLGRYGEPLDPEGDLKAISELKRVLAPGGNLLFVVPVGSPKVIFNLHRIYSYDQIMSYFSDLKLMEFALITTAGDFISPASKELSDNESYGCGCFWFRKD